SSASVTIGGASATAVSVSNGVAITATTPSGALGPADVVVKNPDGQSSTLSGAYTYANPAAAPQISSISPSTGPANGSTQVTITGSGFQYGATVTFGNTPATTMIVYGPTTITAYAPPGSDGPVSVVVTNYDGQTATLTNGFTYSGSVAPSISSISPTSGTTAGGTFVEIDGTGFTSGTTVTMGGSAASVVSTSSTRIVVTTPAHSASAADVIVSNAGGQSILSGGYTYITSVTPPSVSAASPSSGPSGGGTTVSITGTGFTAGATVSFGGVAATGVTATSSTTLRATAPAHAPAVVDVVITNTDGQSATLTGGFTYSQGPAESLLLADNFDSNSISPANWSTGNLFSGTTDTSVNMADQSQQLQIGPLDRNATGSHYNGLRSASTYNFTGGYCYVELVTPPAANTLADAMLTIGTDVNDYYRVYVEGGNLIGQRKAAGTKATLFTQAYDPVNDKYIRIRHNSTSGTAIFEVAPDNSGTPGTWSTIFSEPWNSSIPLTGTIFEIKAGTWQSEANAPGTVVFDNFRAAVPAPPAPAPTVSSVSPTSGSSSGGTSVTVNGTGFQPGASVTFGGTQSSVITVNNSTLITATTPAHAMGAVDLVVTNSDGQTGTLTGGYSYTASAPAPTVSSVSPSSGSTAGGTGITITGTGFSAGATVTVGGAAATNVTVSNSTSINAMTPAHSSGATNVAVTNPDGQTGSLSNGFTYVNAAPTVSAVSPTSGSSAGGTTVGITGTGFMAGATVAFGGTPATGVTVNSATSITATTGAHALGAVDVVVTNSDGQSGTLSGGFTYSSATGETVLLADDFSSNQIDSTKWSTNSLFSGFTDTSVPMTVSNQQLLIGPLDVNTSGSHYNGLRSAGTFNFTGAYSYIEVVTPPGSNGAGDAMLTVGTDVNDFYRVYIEAGTLVCQRKAAGAKATLLTQNYDPVNDKYLRVRHDATTGSAIFEVAPDSGGVPGAWTTIYSEQWNSSIPLTRIIFEIKAGTWEAEPNAPGTVVFDNFRAAVPQ
ncbi:MAG: beta strand repeat-containing protein, partial [Blastocatellia bacterium]